MCTQYLVRLKECKMESAAAIHLIQALSNEGIHFEGGRDGNKRKYDDTPPEKPYRLIPKAPELLEDTILNPDTMREPLQIRHDSHKNQKSAPSQR